LFIAWSRRLSPNWMLEVDPEVTKQAILDAAGSLFAETGFDRATIRAIAARADVDPALVHHYYGTKQALFAAVHELPVNPAELIAALVDALRENRAEQIARFYLSVLAVPGSPFLSLIRAAATHESAARMLREYIEAVLLDTAESLTELPDARLRIALVGSHMIGVVFARSILEIPEITDVEVEGLTTILAPMIDRYLNEPLLV